MKISFNVLSYNRDDIIERNIFTLNEIKVSLENFGIKSEINVIDNASSDKSRQIIKSQINLIDNLILNESNLGVAGGRNIGLKISTGDWVFILDDDSILTEGAVLEIVNVINNYHGDRPVGVFGLNVINMSTGKKLEDDLLVQRDISNFHGAAHVINYKLISEIGGFDELCDFGGEELDYSIRCINNGYKLMFLPHVQVEHFCKPRLGNEQLNRRQKWLKNYIRVIVKHFSLSYALIFSFRYLLSSMFNASKHMGINKAILILPYYFKGVKLGLKQRCVVNRETMLFYSNPELTPEYGNCSIFNKIKIVLNKK